MCDLACSAGTSVGRGAELHVEHCVVSSVKTLEDQLANFNFFIFFLKILSDKVASL